MVKICYNVIMKEIKDVNFFKTDTISLAKNLIGKWIETNIDGQIRIAQISETEAYLGIGDSACHSYKGKLTERTKPMWEEGGTIYIYLCYGLHYLFNIVSCEKGVPEAVLIRAVVEGSGPAKATKYLGIDKRMNGVSMINNSQIRLLDDGQEYAFTTAPRVGIDYALEKDKNALLRFILKK